MVIEVTKEAEHGGRVVKTRDGWEVKAVEVERHGEELGVEKEGKAQVSMDFVCNTSYKRVSIRAQQGLKGQA